VAELVDKQGEEAFSERFGRRMGYVVVIVDDGG
jgi:hypothetical protein